MSVPRTGPSSPPSAATGVGATLNPPHLDKPREAFRREAIRIGDQGEALGSEQHHQHIGHQRPEPSFVKHIRAKDYGKLLGRKVAPNQAGGSRSVADRSIASGMRRTKSSGASS